MRRIRLLVIWIACLGAPESFGQTERLAHFDRATATVETGSGTHIFNVEIARTAEQQSQGLMYRQRLAPDAGMLFLYAAPEQASFWMKNTYIPLDIIFVGPDGRIVRIAERTVPFSLEAIPSGGSVLAVLEVNGGTTARLKIKAGDRLRHSGSK